MMTGDSRLLDALLVPGALRALFHPIHEMLPNGGTRVWAIEALIRGPRDTNLEAAGTLFEFVRRKRAEPMVDRACIGTALAAAAGVPGQPAVALNVHASTLGRDPDFWRFMAEMSEEHRIGLHRIIVEIIEQVPQWPEDTFRGNLEQLRSRGVRVALDDVGIGHSNLRMILEARPQVLKLDGAIVRGCHADYYRWALVESTQALAMRLGAWCVAEGVEEEADLAAVQACGIRLVQGFALSHPMSAAELPVAEPPALRLVLRDLPMEAA